MCGADAANIFDNFHTPLHANIRANFEVGLPGKIRKRPQNSA